MADQSVRITSLPDNSKDGVAFQLWSAIRYTHGGKDTVEGELKLFKACRDVVYNRVYNVADLT